MAIFQKYQTTYFAKTQQPAPLDDDECRRLAPVIQARLAGTTVAAVAELVGRGVTEGTKYQRDHDRFDLGAIVRGENWAVLQSIRAQGGM